MKCEIIRDLLPAYCDCVCSIETAAEIESHVDGCADCKKLLDDYRSDIKSTSGGAPEKPFRRISRKIFRNKLVIIALAILFAAVLGCVGYLTYGQINKQYYHASFETIITSQKAEKMVKKLCAGDIDYVMDNLDINQTGDTLWEYQEEMRVYCRELLTEFYETSLKGKKFKLKKFKFKNNNSSSGYAQFPYETGMTPTAQIILFEGKNISFHFDIAERIGGKLIIINIFRAEDTFDYDFQKLNFALNPYSPKAIVETELLNGRSGGYYIRAGRETFAERFCSTDEEVQKLADKLDELMSSVACEDCYYSHFRFDPENKRYLADMTLFFRENSSGKQIVFIQPLEVNNFNKFKIPDDLKPEFIDEGVSSDIRQQLENLFMLILS